MAVKPRIQQVIVVEGRDDTRRLQEIYQVQTIETHGSAIDAEILDQIRRAQELYGVIVFTDPDAPGHKIRQTVAQAVPGVQHAFLRQDEARPKGKGSLGVEHASPEAIQTALSEVYTIVKAEEEPAGPSIAELRQLGLIGVPKADQRRDWLDKKLRIGHTNGKQLKKRLALFQISLDQVREALADFDEG